MQQIKTGLFHFQLSIMKDGFRKPKPFKEQEGNRHTHMHDVTHLWNYKTHSAQHQNTQTHTITITISHTSLGSEHYQYPISGPCN